MSSYNNPLNDLAVASQQRATQMMFETLVSKISELNNNLVATNAKLDALLADKGDTSDAKKKDSPGNTYIG